MTGDLRLFIAFELPEAIRAAIGRYTQALRALPGRVSWVKADNIHLTLKFLGDTPPQRVEAISIALKDIANSFPPLEATIGGSGVFPNERKPRVVWIGIQEMSAALQNLAAAIDDRMHALGFEKEPRRFSPHLTVGRVREGAIDKVIEKMKAQPFEKVEARFQEITLMRSELHSAGSIYTPLGRFRLGGS
jgi:2'-5' RNA ligase